MESMYSTVRLNEEEWAKHIELEKSRKIRGWKEPDGFEWTYNGQQWGPVLPGETISVPHVAAEHGVKESAVFPRMQDEYGNELMANDKRGSRHAMLEIVKTWHPGDPAKLEDAKAATKEAAYRCPFCTKSIEFDDKKALALHLHEEHDLGEVKIKGKAVSLAPKEQDAA